MNQKFQAALRTKMEEHTDCPTLKSRDSLIQWIHSSPQRTFIRISENCPLGTPVEFGDIKKDDMFYAYDDDIIIKNWDGAETFLATSAPYMWQGIPMIDVQGVF